MHIETLKIFCDLIETKSFSKTAKLNYLTQSAVSQQIKQLEDRYEKKLVERGIRTLKPTIAGEVFYKNAKEILNKFYMLERLLTENSDTLCGIVKASVIYSIGLHEMPIFLKPFLKEHPNVSVHMEYSRTSRIYEDVCANMVDFGIVAIPKKRRLLDVKPLFCDRLVFVCHPDHELAKHKVIKPKQLHDVPFIAFDRDIPTRKLIDKYLKQHGVSPQIAMEFSNVETIKGAVEVNSGVAIVPKPSVFKEKQTGTLKVIDLDGEPLMRPVCMIYRKDKVFEPAVQHFIDDLESMAQKIGKTENEIGIYKLGEDPKLFLDELLDS